MLNAAVRIGILEEMIGCDVVVVAAVVVAVDDDAESLVFSDVFSPYCRCCYSYRDYHYYSC